MRIVHLEDFVHPDAGYQVNMLARLQARDGHDVTIVTAEPDKVPTRLTAFFGSDDMEGRDARFLRESGARIIRLPLIGYYSGRGIFNYFQLLRTVKNLQPDAVFVHGEDTLTGIVFILLSRWLPYPLLYDCHSVEMASVNRFKHVFRFFYRHLVAPVLLRNKIPLVRIMDCDFVEKCLGIPVSYTHFLSYGTDTDYFRPEATTRAKFRSEFNISPNAFIALYAGKMDAEKGGQFLADALKAKVVSKTGREVVFIVVGNTEGEYGKKVESTFSLSENRILRFPTQRYTDLARFYQSVDLAITARQCTMSFFEFQACGLPVLFETNEINVQRGKHNNAALFRPGDVTDFREKLVELIDMPSQDYDRMRVAARNFVVETYDFVPISRQFTELLAAAARNFQLKKSRPA